MAKMKSNVNVKIDSDIKERATQIIECMGLDQTTETLKNNPKKVELEADADGNIIVDKEQHPDIYNWVVQG